MKKITHWNEGGGKETHYHIERTVSHAKKNLITNKKCTRNQRKKGRKKCVETPGTLVIKAVNLI
jgi:hypothetical protein